MVESTLPTSCGSLTPVANRSLSSRERVSVPAPTVLSPAMPVPSDSSSPAPDEDDAPTEALRESNTQAQASDLAALQVILRNAAAGDQAAWRHVVDAYSGRVFGLIRAQCNDGDLAEEITQSTFCTIATKIAGYTEAGKFEQWLFRIAMNRLRDEMRRRKRQAKSMDDEAQGGLASRPEPGHRPERPETIELKRLRRALAQLSDADQRIVHLRHYGGLSFKQIAEILEQPLGTVLARQHRALKKLAELMENDRA